MTTVLLNLRNYKMLNILCALCLISTTFTAECMLTVFTKKTNGTDNHKNSNGNNGHIKNGNGINSHINGNGTNNGHTINGNGKNGNSNSKDDKYPTKNGIKKTRSQRSVSTDLNSKVIPTNSNNSIIITCNTAIITPPIEHPFNAAVRFDNKPLIEKFLSYPGFDPNIQHGDIGTAIHICIKTCIESKNFSLLELLLKKALIRSTAVNKRKQTAQYILKQYRLNESDRILKKEMALWSLNLFIRGNLDAATKKICLIDLQSLYQNGLLTKGDNNIINATGKIKDHIKATEKSQNEDKEDRELPQVPCFPEYATPEFMEELIWSTLNENQLQISSTPTTK